MGRFSSSLSFRSIPLLILLLPVIPAASGISDIAVDLCLPSLTFDQGLYGTVANWTCGTPELLEHLPGGVTGYRTDGCSYSGPDGRVLLPSRHFYFAIPPGATVTFSVEPRGVELLSRDVPDIGRVDAVDGLDVFTSASLDDVPGTWGEISETGVWRRAGFAHVVVHPVILDDRGLLSAQGFRLVLGYTNEAGSRPVPVSGDNGELLGALFTCGNSVWLEPRTGTDADSPFWGLPWARIRVDTAGVYTVEGSDIPFAVGSLSSTLSLFCGRGREMGTTPWDSVFVPWAVPILVEDGGDGIFDSGDRLIFLGRGVSWWYPTGEENPPHFMSRYSHENCYWLTWGGEDGARMGVVDGNPGTAPALPGDYVARYHFEKEMVRSKEFLTSDWAWDRVSGTHNQWVYHDFDTPGASGSGVLRVALASAVYGTHEARVLLNGIETIDTTWTGSGGVIFSVPCSGLQGTDNTLAIEFILEGTSSDELYLDWFEVFPATGYTGVPGQIEVPLEWLGDTGRYRVDWSSDLTGCYVFQSSGDTLASVIEWGGGSSFEFDMPVDWRRKARGLWLAGGNDLLSPVGIEDCSPGRILATLTGGDVVYVYADFFSSDVDGLNRPDRLRQLISAQEIYDEFNGGVRDPAAIRAFMDYCITNWDPMPADLVLVGYGNWDPRQFLTTKTTYIDIVYSDDGTAVTDDVYTIIHGAFVPQAGVSRISIETRTDLQKIVDRAIDYFSGDFRGNWQAHVLAAADDERSSKHTGDETYHTDSMENLVNDHLPGRLRPIKLYEIFFDWNSQWKKPEARQAYIDAWSDGALLSIYLGHGGHDQLADEGLLYLEDTELLACSGRLPVAIFGSCNVGEFQNPVMDCIAQDVTLSSVGGAITGCGATGETTGLPNEALLALIMDHFWTDRYSISTCLLLAKIDHGYSNHDRLYVLFGDASLFLALADSSGTYSSTPLLSGELSELSGQGPSEGLILVRAFESCSPDTYYTFRQTKPIPYIASGSLFYRGAVPAMPDFSTDAFVPVDADTGRLARVEFFFLGNDGESLAALYPFPLDIGSPSSGDTIGPDIELWVDGFRYVEHPAVSGQITVRAALSDPSGINLLGNTGRQLALYVDGTPQDVSRFFNYYPGSGEAGELEVGIGTLEMGEHELELRAADGLLNISTATLGLTVIAVEGVTFEQVFVFPNPCSDNVAISWTQSSNGAVSISIYTVSGRCIATWRNIEGSTGYNQFVWDCCDGDGDFVAGGTYLFRLSTESRDSPAGTADEYTGVIALIR